MTVVSQLLASLAASARANSRSEFDRIERELLSHFEGTLEGMPAAVYDEYLAVDRLWPVIRSGDESDPSPAETSSRLTLSIRLSIEAERWLREIGNETDRSPSAVIGECLERIRTDETLQSAVTEALRARTSSGSRRR